MRTPAGTGTRALLCAFASCLLGLAAAGAAPPQPLDEREVDVLSALVRHGLAPDTPMLVLAARTSGDAAAITVREEAVAALTEALGIPRSAVDDWSRRNRAPSLIEKPLDLPVSYQMLNEKALAELFADVPPDQGWQRFFARYPGAPGIVRVSRPGFDDSLSHAMVYIEHTCGAQCGAGRVVHLRLGEDGRWRVVDGAVVWMAG